LNQWQLPDAIATPAADAFGCSSDAWSLAAALGSSGEAETPEDPAVEATFQQPEAEGRADDVRNRHGRDCQTRLDLQGEERRQQTSDPEPGYGGDTSGNDGNDDNQGIRRHWRSLNGPKNASVSLCYTSET
jgi:hypothetical protein